jgi:hypothetical protein
MNYTLKFASNTHIREFQEFISNNHIRDFSPFFAQQHSLRSRYVSTVDMENYLRDTTQQDDRATLVILDAYSLEKVRSETHFYYMPPFKKIPEPNHPDLYQIAGGGLDSNLVFLDLSAGPTQYRSTPESALFTTPLDGVNATLVPPIWSYNDSLELSTALVSYIKDAVIHRFGHMYSYTPPAPLQEVQLSYVVVDLVGQGESFFAQVQDEYILKSYRNINPLLNWTSSRSDWNWTDDNDFVDLVNEYAYDASFSGGGVLLSYIKSIYTSIFELSTRENLMIPIFLLLLPSGRQFEWNGYSDNSVSNAPLIFSVVNEDNFANYYYPEASRLTFITMHEIGHSLGLAHPFESYDQRLYTTDPRRDPLTSYNWLWDFTSSQMSYVNAHKNISAIDTTNLQRYYAWRYTSDLWNRLHTIQLSFDGYGSITQERVATIFTEMLALLEESIMLLDHGRYSETMSTSMAGIDLYSEILDHNVEETITTGKTTTLTRTAFETITQESKIQILFVVLPIVLVFLRKIRKMDWLFEKAIR